MKSSISSALGSLAVAIIIIAMFIIGNASYQHYGEQVFLQEKELFPTPTGKLQVSVVDGFKETPIEGATVVIPETGDRYATDREGKTPAIQVPILTDEHFAKILQKPWGEITLLVYKDGYIEYALFHAHVWENQMRNGPKILLFPKEANGRNEPFSIIEGPHRLWVNQLVDQYRKK